MNGHRVYLAIVSQANSATVFRAHGAKVSPTYPSSKLIMRDKIPHNNPFRKFHSAKDPKKEIYMWYWHLLADILRGYINETAIGLLERSPSANVRHKRDGRWGSFLVRNTRF